MALRESDTADASKNFRYFLESADKFEEVSRGRFGTVRARMMYTMSAAFDPQQNAIYTVTVPNDRTRRLVVSRFDRGDMTLSEEYSPKVAIALRQDASVDRLYVTGAAIANGRHVRHQRGGQHARRRRSGDAYDRRRVRGPRHQPPHRYRVRRDELVIVGEDGRVTMAAMPASS